MGRYSHSRSRSRSQSPDDHDDGHRVHVADIVDATKRDLEKACDKYGPTQEIWMARGPPCFAFVVFKYREDAEDCVKEMNGKTIRNNRVRVTHALPRTRGRGRRKFDPDMRCYACGQRGHFSRDCNDFWDSRNRRSPSPRFRRQQQQRSRRSRSNSWPRDRNPRRRSRSRSRSRSRRQSRSRSRSKSRAHSPPRDRSPVAVRGRSRSRS